MSKTLTSNQYTKLLKDLRGILQEGKARAQEAVANELVNTYWQVGKRIVEANLTNNARYSDVIIQDLSEELTIDVRTLQRCVVFFHTYSAAPRGRNLTWSHYRELLALPSDEQRQWYQEQSSEHAWSRNKLVDRIKSNAWQESQIEDSVKIKTKLARPKEATYVYKAIVERVVDGDTLLVRLDLGFATWKEQRIRLAGIDAPALDEPGGKKAYEYVLNQLAKVEFVMIKTNKIDIYGRYVGHVFYNAGSLSKANIFSKGRYLNGELLTKNLARRM